MSRTRDLSPPSILRKDGQELDPRMSHDHDHDHGHGQDAPSDPALRVKALETALKQRGLVDEAAIDKVVDYFEKSVGPRNGAKMIAKAWTDPAYKARLLADGTAAAAELGYAGPQGEHLIAVENTGAVHNLVVCTLCSCYPVPILGLPPRWYKSHAYRSRAVIDPRGVLEEFGLAVGDKVEVRVWDSTAELRYLVIPERPSGTENLSAQALADLVSRDAMIGTAKVAPPDARR
jgi:nitrile hydratase